MEFNTLKEAYKARFGTMPECLVRSPGRINLLGEHIDYNLGVVLPGAIDKSIRMAAGRREDAVFAFYALDFEEYFQQTPGDFLFQRNQKWVNYLLGALNALQKAGHSLKGFNLVFSGDIPQGSGLSSSAALESGLLFACRQLFDLALSNQTIALLAQQGEQDFVGVKCGIMDMFTSLMGKKNHLIKLDCRNLEFQYMPFQSKDYSLILLDSGIKHTLVESAYNQRREACEEGVSILKSKDASISSLRDVSGAFLDRHAALLPATVYRRCRYVVSEMERVELACKALQNNDFNTLGALMYACHKGLDQVYEVCVEQTNHLVDWTLQFTQPNKGIQVLGARQVGGGFGGCTLNLIASGTEQRFIESAQSAYLTRFGLDLKAYAVCLGDGVESISDFV